MMVPFTHEDGFHEQDGLDKRNDCLLLPAPVLYGPPRRKGICYSFSRAIPDVDRSISDQRDDLGGQ